MDFRLKDPDDMTPEERMERIVELLAIGCIRMAEKERQGQPSPTAEKGDSSLDFPAQRR